jgi:hypothetical protein
MRAVGTVALVLVAAAMLLCANQAAAVFDLCDDCEAKGARGGCGSALACMGKMPGTTVAVGKAKGRCYDLEHEDCDDEPQEVCCGLKIFDWGGKSASYVPAESIPDGDPLGASWTIVIDEPIVFEFLDVGMDISHGYMSELEITLEHMGIVVTLMTMPECEAALLSEKRLWFSDEGVGPIQATPDLCAELFPGFETLEDGPYVPSTSLEPFNFVDPLGEWTLTITDMAPGRAVGEVHGWELAFGWELATPSYEFSWGMVKALYR